MSGHCLHAHPTPGAFVCCRCKRRSDCFPGLTRNVVFSVRCEPRRFALLRHLTESWMFRIPVGGAP